MSQDVDVRSEIGGMVGIYGPAPEAVRQLKKDVGRERNLHPPYARAVHQGPGELKTKATSTVKVLRATGIQPTSRSPD